MMRRAGLAVMLGVVLLSASCAGGDGSGDGGPRPQAPGDVDAALGAMCDLIARCPDFHPMATRNRRECIDVLYWLLTCRLDEQNDELVGVRRVEIDLSRAESEACAAVFAGVSCEDLNGRLDTSLGSEGEACLPLFVGLSDDEEDAEVATGCLYTGQCPSGQYCPIASFDDAMSAPACRACRGPLQRGDVCVRYNSTVPCDEGLFCVDDGGGDGTGYVCGDPLANGGYCNDDTECTSGFCEYQEHVCSAGRADDETCDGDHWCLSGYCHHYSQFDRRCARDGKEGDACNAPTDCLEPLTCIDDACTPRGELGDPCTDDDHCVIGMCDLQDQRCGIRNGAACDVEPYIGLCRSGWCDNETYICRPKVATGEDCSFSQVCEIGWCDSFDLRCGIAAGHNCRFMTQYCREGFCDNDTGLCTVPLTNGTACTVDSGCASGYCARDSMTCAADARPLADGEVCTNNTDCASQSCSSTCYSPCNDVDDCESGEYCSWQDQRCYPQLSDGSSCESDEDCVSGYCNSDDLCMTKPEIGDPCSGFSDCYPLGYCHNSVCDARLRPGATCDQQDSCLEPYVCLSGTCVLPSLRCEPAPVGEACTYFRFCADGGYCDPSTFSCVPQHRSGESCSRDEECGSALYCNYNAVEGPVCAAASAIGEACGEDQPCVRDAVCVEGMCATVVHCDTSADCDGATYCEEGTCAPHGALGDRCISSEDDMCGPGLYCDIDCEERMAQGASCASYMPCLEHLRCVRETSTCEPRAAEGDSCDSDEDCLDGLLCDSDQTCQPRRDFGEYCYEDADCASHICFQDYCSAVRECSGG